jgi:hypothetical protein
MERGAKAEVVCGRVVSVWVVRARTACCRRCAIEAVRAGGGAERSEACVASKTKWLGWWWHADPAWRGERDQVADGWGTWKRISRIFIDTNFDSWLEKISRIIGNIRRKFLDIEYMIWNNFHYWDFLSNFTDFYLNCRFPFRFEFLGSWSLKEFVSTSITSPLYKRGQNVLHDGLQSLLFHLSYMHALTPKIGEGIEFQKGLSVKQFLEILKSSESNNIEL